MHGSLPDLTIEVPAVDEIDAVADLWVTLATGQRRYGSHLLAGENREAVRDALVRHAVVDALYVARAPEVVGFVMFGTEMGTYEQDVRRGIVHNLYVVDDHRGTGVGSALLAAAEEALEAEGAEAVALEVLAGNEDARRFYARNGYDEHRCELEKPLRATAAENDTHSKEDR